MFERLVADDSNTKYSASVVYIKTLKQIEQAQIQYAYEQPPRTAKQQRSVVSGDRAKHQYEQQKIANQVLQRVWRAGVRN